jgi:polyferredoxin
LNLQTRRRWFQAGFFALFVLAPPLDLLRLDLNLGHFVLLGQDWTLGLDAFLHGRAGPAEAAWNLFWRGLLPIAALVGGGVYAAWRWGRLYCGWLCPHFSVVELINGLMRRASGRPSVWERKPLPRRQPDGRVETPDRRWWPVTWLAALGFAFLWAVTLLTYLLPPAEIYHNLLHASLTGNQLRFLGVGTALLFIEFTFARHLFCRFGCAVGLFQSLAWMANDRALVVGFDTRRARECSDCNNACDNACPMRLKPRTLKRKMFTCTECARCVSACDQVTAGNPAGSLLSWVQGDAALPVVSGRPAAKPHGPAPETSCAVPGGD